LEPIGKYVNVPRQPCAYSKAIHIALIAIADNPFVVAIYNPEVKALH